MPAFPHVHEEQLGDGRVSLSSHREMAPSGDGPHVLQAEFRVPRLRKVPSVSVQIVQTNGEQPFVVTSLKINLDLGAETQIAVAAQAVDGRHPESGKIYC